MAGRVRLSIVAFLVFALAPIALFGRDGPWYGGGNGPKLERRAPFPSKFRPNTFRRISLWLTDRIGMRFPLLVFGSRWQTQLWGHRVRNQVLIGRDEWLFYTDDETQPPARMADLRGRLRLPEGDAAAIDRHFAAIRAALAACGRTAFVLVAPNKQSIYPERLHARVGYQPSRFDGLLEKLGPEARSVFIDPRPELRAAKATETHNVYYKMDTHWNPLGMLIAYQKMVATLARANAIASPELAARSGFDISAEPFYDRDVAEMLFLPWDWTFPDEQLRLREKSPVPTTQVDHVGDAGGSGFLGTVKAYQVFRNPAGSRRLLIQGDSFLGPLVPLLSRHFAETHVFLRAASMAVFDGDLIARLKPDVVMLELAERHLPALRDPPRNLARMCE